MINSVPRIPAAPFHTLRPAITQDPHARAQPRMPLGRRGFLARWAEPCRIRIEQHSPSGDKADFKPRPCPACAAGGCVRTSPLSARISLLHRILRARGWRCRACTSKQPSAHCRILGTGGLPDPTLPSGRAGQFRTCAVCCTAIHTAQARFGIIFLCSD